VGEQTKWMSGIFGIWPRALASQSSYFRQCGYQAF